jgi:sporulation protein YlmC with PRC-barrel domain
MAQSALGSPGPSFPRCQGLLELRRYRIGATGGDLGHVGDVYFDAQSWTVRHLVIDTRRWPRRRVLLSPHLIERIDVPGRRLVTGLARPQIEASPRIHGRQPHLQCGDTHLHSADEVHGYSIRATDGELGRVEDHLLDLEDWAIRYLIVAPRSGWPGVHVLLPPDWITAVSSDERIVQVDVSRDAVRAAPHYDPVAALELDFETRYWGHLARPGYWERPAEDWW